ncbi:hypothetical protein DI005_20235 [Prauserella sp. PE36]|uniref:hypothetical protein n=1 Tax=Prauserella sp. PE36 TaxID=1504709 RepID=UPI000DE520BF|nr:hypothetical protein [Prauserella sp. PE36]RBM18124.1 hypothetical protein DI005_20235 [Prauserella sp. PE36]
MGNFSTVYLVEDHTDDEPAPYTRYWLHVYTSRDKAKAGVEHYAQRGGHGPVRWQEHSPSSYAYRADGARDRELYRIVPLNVQP